MMYKSASRPERTPISYESQAKTSQLTAALYYTDTAGNMDRPNPEHANAAERNYGLQKRASFTDRGATVDMIGYIHSDIFFRERYMLDEVNVNVRLVRNKDWFCLMLGEANPSYKVKLISAVLLVRKVQLSPSVFLTHAKALESGLAKYSNESYARPTLSRQATWTVITRNCLQVNSRRGS